MEYQFSGEIINRGTDQYDAARRIWNRSIDVYPKGIITCKNTYDVCTAVNFVRSCNERCRIATGMHNAAGFCTDNDVYVIALNKFDTCDYLEQYRMVSCGCACNCMSICSTLSKSDCFFPGPNPFSCVGVWSLSGGIGCSCRKYGLGCDYLAQVELVDYRGEILTCNANTYPDLFWAIKGAGAGNFGIVTGLTYYLPEPVKSICYFELRMETCTRSSIISFLEVWQDWVCTLDMNVNCQTQFCNTFHAGIYIFGYGVSYLSVEETRRCLGPLGAVRGLSITYESKSYLSFMNSRQGFYGRYERYTNMGRFVYDQYAQTDLESLADIIWGRRAEGSIYSSLTLTAMGGFVSNYSRQDTAFYYRDARYLMSLKTQWFDESMHSNNDFWMAKQYGYLSSITRGGYINQPYLGYNDYELEYYGENLSWLKEVKYRYDPYNFFEFPQGIRL